ncbi:enolase C-terminal domain-like protein, partial [Enterococcus faecalis]|uniref:enolase C-terminal domain-like protein n=1 Tax=Enterococcus faecalis TaxID=1351 RepID=UPI003CC57C29
LKQVQLAVEKGYLREKLKIRPAYDVEPDALIRQLFPNLPLMVDANSAYTLAELPQLHRLDHYQLAMIEQPIAADDFLDHA